MKSSQERWNKEEKGEIRKKRDEIKLINIKQQEKADDGKNVKKQRHVQYRSIILQLNWIRMHRKKEKKRDKNKRKGGAKKENK